MSRRTTWEQGQIGRLPSSKATSGQCLRKEGEPVFISDVIEHSDAYYTNCAYVALMLGLT
jgi:hypothetical protein